MVSLPERIRLDPKREQTGTEYGFTWARVDGTTVLRSPDRKYKRVPQVVVETLSEHAADRTIDELIAETADADPAAADVIREMRDGGFIRPEEPVERIDPPSDIRLWPRALLVGVLLCIGGWLWLDTFTSIAGPILEEPIGYLLGAVWIAIPLVVGSVVVHEFGHYNTAWRQGLDPSTGVTIINGLIPAVVTRTHDGWLLPRNRRLWNTLAGPAYGLVWTIGAFILYGTLVPHPGVAVAALFCFNMQCFVLLPIFHGDGYLLLTDVLDEQNLRTRGIADLRSGRPTWAAAYAGFTYGFVATLFAVDVIVGYLVGDLVGIGVVLCLVCVIYANARFDLVARLVGPISSLRK